MHTVKAMDAARGEHADLDAMSVAELNAPLREPHAALQEKHAQLLARDAAGADVPNALAEIRDRKNHLVCAAALGHPGTLLNDARIEIDNNAEANALRCVALGRRNYVPRQFSFSLSPLHAIIDRQAKVSVLVQAGRR
jgi:hypothetical protein